jgi:hypothetical protein
LAVDALADRAEASIRYFRVLAETSSKFIRISLPRSLSSRAREDMKRSPRPL